MIILDGFPLLFTGIVTVGTHCTSHKLDEPDKGLTLDHYCYLLSFPLVVGVRNGGGGAVCFL